MGSQSGQACGGVVLNHAEFRDLDDDGEGGDFSDAGNAHQDVEAGFEGRIGVAQGDAGTSGISNLQGSGGGCSLGTTGPAGQGGAFAWAAAMVVMAAAGARRRRNPAV